MSEREFEAWLVQRITRCRTPEEPSTALDKNFSFDYMGAAEFEFGALPKSVKAWRESHTKSPCTNVTTFSVTDVREQTLPLYLVTDTPTTEYIADIIKMFQAECRDRRTVDHKAPLYLSSVKREGFASTLFSRVCGWWAVHDGRGLNWAVFKDSGHAQIWLSCIAQ